MVEDEISPTLQMGKLRPTLTEPQILSAPSHCGPCSHPHQSQSSEVSPKCFGQGSNTRSLCVDLGPSIPSHPELARWLVLFLPADWKELIVYDVNQHCVFMPAFGFFLFCFALLTTKKFFSLTQAYHFFCRFKLSTPGSEACR